jgi:hypothetical protein
MLSKSVQQRLLAQLGVEADSAAWCTIGKIPQPPEDVHREAGRGRLRPGLMRPLGMAGVVLAFPFMLLALVLGLLDTVLGGVQCALSTEEERAKERSDATAVKRRDAAIVQHRLDHVFDGDWHGAAGQFLLRWYSHSSHHQRFVLLAQGRIVLAAPPRRVSIRREQRMRVVAEISAQEAVLEDPLLGKHESDKLRIRFTDGSWVSLTAEEAPSDIHEYLRRQLRGDGEHQEI